MRALGWAVLGVGAGVAASAFGAVLAADRGTRERIGASARQVRAHVEHTGERWTASALEARDRLTETTEGLRHRVEDTAGEWRDRSAENVGRALLQAAEARDATLDDLDDADDADPAPDRD